MYELEEHDRTVLPRAIAKVVAVQKGAAPRA